MIDIHNHILYGTDDGAADLQEAVEMAQIACREGITAIVATPHFRIDRHNDSPETLRTRLEEIRQAVKKLGIPLTLYLGHELYYGDGAEEALEEHRVCTMHGSAFILVEFSPDEEYTYIRNAVDHLMGLGYLPIIAHAERYRCMVNNPGYLWELRNMGSKIQINAASVISGPFRRFTRRLLDEELVDYLATDAHGSRERKPEMKRCRAYLYRKYRRPYVDAILVKNAGHIVKDKSL